MTSPVGGSGSGSSEEDRGIVTCICLQVGLVREIVPLDTPSPAIGGGGPAVHVDTSSNVSADTGLLTAVRDAAANFVIKRFPERRFYGLRDRLLLFVHDQQNPNILQLLKSSSQLTDGVLVEVVLSALVTLNELCSRPHNLAVHNYKSPTFCDLCGEMLWGLIKQGVKCEGCGMNFHKRCVYKVKNNCTNQKEKRKTSLGDDTLSPLPVIQPNNFDKVPHLPRRVQSEIAPCSPYRHGATGNKFATLPRSIQVPHTFVVHNNTRPTVCQHCHKLLTLFRRAYQCKDCQFNCHKKCVNFVPNNCQPGENDNNSQLTDGESPTDAEIQDVSCVLTGITEGSESKTDDDESATDNCDAANIPLMRVVQSVRHTKRAGTNIIREGWMVHYTNKDKTRRLHFWRLDTKSITMFISKSTSRYFKEIQLSDIVKVEKYSSNGTQRQFVPYHVFEIYTADTVYFVGEDSDVGSEVEESGRGRQCACWMESAIHQALLPVTPKQSAADNGAVGSTTEVKVIVEANEKKDITQLYEVFPDDILGSGQFGIVYGGIERANRQEVAIKVIDKLRFPNKDKDVLKNEVSILKNLHHPGIVNLQDMFETPAKIYIIMEKLRGDMLEMILSSPKPKGRLNERTTRFLISQILKALQYLHAKPRSIVHCDLKPENVLLSTAGSFPQVKLCDFGFARIIGEKSFRRSLVGTPAYLAPEVLNKQCYNRSLDMWSVGVILYVSLSGTFPFNEDEDIADQIQNAAFMYPPNPWKEVSHNAIDVISKLLQVKLGCRFTADQSLDHVWFQDYQCWCDLRKLESIVGERYLTRESEDAKWTKYQNDLSLDHWTVLGHHV